MKSIVTGNVRQHDDERGWFVGAFMPQGDPRHTDRLEIKYGRHAAGEQRTDWTDVHSGVNVCVLIEGSFDLIFPDKTVELRKKGDYVVCDKSIPYRWKSHLDTECLTVRWYD